jgi:hypothetical protein
MRTPTQLRQLAERYRRLKRFVLDRTTEKVIGDLVGEYEATADEMERRQRIRERAHDMWIKHGRPAGRDVEFWLAAEKEVDSHSERQQRTE